MAWQELAARPVLDVLELALHRRNIRVVAYFQSGELSNIIISGGRNMGNMRLIIDDSAREIQQQEGLTPQIWGPPTSGSGHSTPLRETIPESPSSDSFPDFDAGQATGGSPNPASASSSIRRTRAGTVPSRFPAMSISQQSSPGLTKSGQVTPSSSPYGNGSALHNELPTSAGASIRGPPTSNAALLSRLRAGSLPQRTPLLGGSPFGNSLFASSWMAGRERASTLQSIRSSDGPSSPNGSPADGDVRTLDYLGLVDTPNQGRNSLSQVNMDMLMNQQLQNGVSIADLAALNAFNNKNTANRFRSYSVNAKEKYTNGDQDDLDEYEQMEQQLYANGTLTPNSEMTAAHAAAIHEAVRQHNIEVQAFANYASVNRPRARTAGVLDSPSSRVLRNYMPTPSRLDNSMTAADLHSNDGSDYGNIAAAVHNMNLNKQSSYENGLDSGNLDSPTRSLWLGSIPSSTTVSSLNAIFMPFGPIEFARVLTHKSCGFVNFENIQSAIAAKTAYNGKEIFPGCGPVRIGFAKEQSASNTPGANGAYPSPSPDPFVSKSRNDGAGSSAATGGNINAETAAAALVTPDLMELREEIADIVQQFGAAPDEQARISQSLEDAMSYSGHQHAIPPILEPSHNRIHDAPRLREIRKRIDNNNISPVEIENIAMEMLPEIAELASDYLGNTVVQKLFENSSEETKEAMLTQLAPHLSEIGVHKNGTWAAQKIIDVARTSTQMSMIVDSLRPHGVNLFLDQYGNYVMQCCLRFQAPLNQFIFDTALNRLWTVAQGRFGARAVRACLESHFATNDQKRLMAAAIALHSVQLATNSNGALLLTWFLDTCTYPRRRSVLAPRIIPHLVHLCTHKVAYLTVLKIINQRNEPDARDSILQALFFDDQTLFDIISDQACGATFVFKVLTTPFLDESMRPECLENVRNVLVRLKAQPTQGYKRLMDEVGMSTRHGGTPVSHDGRSNSRSRQRNGNLPHLDTQNGYQRPPYATPQHIDPNMGAGLQRTISMESNGYDPYVQQQYTHSPAMSNAGASPINVQYQQAMLAQGGMARPPGFYAAPGGMSPYGGASPAPHMVDPYRQNMAASPMVPPGMGMQTGYQQQVYGSPMLGMPGALNGYGYMPSQPYFVQGQMPQQQGQMNGNGRRGRNNRNNGHGNGYGQ